MLLAGLSGGGCPEQEDSRGGRVGHERVVGSPHEPWRPADTLWRIPFAGSPQILGSAFGLITLPFEVELRPIGPQLRCSMVNHGRSSENRLGSAPTIEVRRAQD